MLVTASNLCFRRFNTSAILLKPRCESVETVNGMVVNIGGVSVVSIMSIPPMLYSAHDFCIDKNADEILKSLETIMENRIREVAEKLEVIKGEKNDIIIFFQL